MRLDQMGTYCTALQMEDSKPRVCLQDWPTGRIMIGAGLEVVCWGINWTPCWPPPILILLRILQFHLCLSNLPLHLRMRVSLNMSTSWLSRPGITTPLVSIRAHTLVTVRTLKITQFEKGTFPELFQPLPPLPDSALLQELRTRTLTTQVETETFL